MCSKEDSDVYFIGWWKSNHASKQFPSSHIPTHSPNCLRSSITPKLWYSNSHHAIENVGFWGKRQMDQLNLVSSREFLRRITHSYYYKFTHSSLGYTKFSWAAIRDIRCLIQTSPCWLYCNWGIFNKGILKMVLANRYCLVASITNHGLSEILVIPFLP